MGLAIEARFETGITRRNSNSSSLSWPKFKNSSFSLPIPWSHTRGGSHVVHDQETSKYTSQNPHFKGYYSALKSLGDKIVMAYDHFATLFLREKKRYVIHLRSELFGATFVAKTIMWTKLLETPNLQCMMNKKKIAATYSQESYSLSHRWNGTNRKILRIISGNEKKIRNQNTSRPWEMQSL